MTTGVAVGPKLEMSSHPLFRRRLKRLIVVSLVALGMITILAWTDGADALTVGVLAAGWALMPALLYAGLRRPGWRYLLVVPATLVTVGLLRVATEFAAPGMASLGWWSITAGVMVGAALGAWFWYRWLPVPTRLDDPFSPGRWTLIGVHSGLVLAGMAMVLAG